MAAQQANPDSMYAFYRGVLGLRHGRAVWGNGALKLLAPAQPNLLAYVRSDSRLSYLVALNLGAADVADSLITTELGGASAATLVLGAGSLLIQGETAQITIPANGYVIFELQ